MLKKLFIFTTILFSLFALFSNTAAYGENASSSAHVEYNLAYPGMLPDNPLYKLKLIRDRIIDFLITDPQKRTDYYLLRADKGILAAAILIDKKNISLAEQTVLRAEHNMTMLNNEFQRMPKKPNDVLFKKLNTASLKHQEVLVSLMKRLLQNQQKTFEQVMEFSKRNQAMVEKYQMRPAAKWNLPDY